MNENKKEMKYIGTRNKNVSVKASEAILKGICDDGGLFVPEYIPSIDKPISELIKLNYKQLAYDIMKLYLTDFTENELKSCIDGAYDSKFDDEKIAPVVVKDGVGILELFHGKTIAFKDMALSILPYFMKTSAMKNGVDKEIVILAATSGDTGKAALEGFADVAGTSIIVFFPENGVSPVQKRQMTTQTGKNTCVVGIKGNFDDAQSAVKDIFTDESLKEYISDNGYVFSSANSINIGRLVPQIVYYFYAYSQMVQNESINVGDGINFVVPTGNFGNILAGYYAKCMGLPIKKLICASNDNKVLYDFFKTGTYDKNREFVVTASPSMDILISSNLERLIFKMVGQENTAKLMASLKSDGKYSIEITEKDIIGEFADENETFSSIKSLFEKTGYVMDTHTAVAYASYKKYSVESGDNTKTVIVSTASPYKFAKDVVCAIDNKYKEGNPFELMNVLEKLSGTPIPEPIKDIENREILHSNVIEKNDIKSFVKNKLNKK